MSGQTTTDKKEESAGILTTPRILSPERAFPLLLLLTKIGYFQPGSIFLYT